MAIGIVTWQGGRSWQAVVERGRIPQSFRRARKCKFSRQKRRFLLSSGDRQFVVVKGLLWKQVLLTLRALQKQDVFRQEFYDSRMSFGECSMKAGWLLLRVLRKQDDLRWKLYESRISFVESSAKAGWLSLSALRKQDDFRWVLFKSRMTFVESSTKAFQKARKSRL